MKGNKQHIDDCFKQHLTGAKLTPPPDAFAVIQSQLPSWNPTLVTAKATNAATWSLKTLLIVGTTFIASGTAIWLFNKPNKQNTGANVTSTVMDQKQQDSLGKLPQAGVVSETSRRELVSPEIKEEEMLEVFRKPTLNATESIEVVQEVVVADKSEADLALWNEEKVTTIESVPSKREVPNKVLIHSNDAIQNCRGRLSVECLEDVDGPWELSVFSNSGFAQYEVGCGLDLLTKQLGKQLRWKGKVNVKNSQWVTFWISAHFEDGCRDTVYLNRMVQPNPTNATWLIPTVFTPNHDGYNDSFYVQIPEPMEYEVLIVDNTGNHVFKSRNVFEKWGGNYREMPVPSGNYRLILKTRYAGEREPSTKSQVLVLKRN